MRGLGTGRWGGWLMGVRFLEGDENVDEIVIPVMGDFNPPVRLHTFVYTLSATEPCTVRETVGRILHENYISIKKNCMGKSHFPPLCILHLPLSRWMTQPSCPRPSPLLQLHAGSVSRPCARTEHYFDPSPSCIIHFSVGSFPLVCKHGIVSFILIKQK